MKQEDGKGIGDPVHKYYSFPSEARDFSRGYFTVIFTFFCNFPRFYRNCNFTFFLCFHHTVFRNGCDLLIRSGVGNFLLGSNWSNNWF